MPYMLKKVKGGYYVVKLDDPNRAFSRKLLSREMAIKQMRALYFHDRK